MYKIGIDIGSTSCKVIVLNSDDSIEYKTCINTGRKCVDSCKQIINKLQEMGYDINNSTIVATDYGRVSVPYAKKPLLKFLAME